MKLSSFNLRGIYLDLSELDRTLIQFDKGKTLVAVNLTEVMVSTTWNVRDKESAWDVFNDRFLVCDLCVRKKLSVREMFLVTCCQCEGCSQSQLT